MTAVIGGMEDARTAELPCGLRVVHMRLPGAVAIGASLGVDVGSADEPDEWAGVSHFLEHLVFRGTAAFADSVALDGAIEAVGGNTNAFTGKSYTQYLCTAPLTHRALVARIPAELVVRPLLRQADIEEERPVVIREIGLAEDNAGSRMARALEQAAWPDSSMARPILGRAAALQAVTAEDVRRYWAAHYTPRKAIFGIAGDLTLDEALALAADAVGDWQPAGADAPPASAPTLPAGGALRMETMPGRQETVLAIGAPVGPWRAIDQAVVGVLATLAGEGEGSLLVRSLVRRRGVLLNGGALHWLNRDAGVLGLSGSARPAAVAAATGGIMDVLRQLQTPAPAADFQRAVGYVRGDILRQWLRPLDVAVQLCHQALMGDTAFGPRRELEELAAVTPEGVAETAQRYFAPERLRLALAGPVTDLAAVARTLQAA